MLNVRLDRATTWPRSTRWSSAWSARCSPRPAAGWARPEQQPDREKFVELVTEAVWLQIAGMAAGRGVELDPDVPVEALLEAAFDGAAG